MQRCTPTKTSAKKVSSEEKKYRNLICEATKNALTLAKKVMMEDPVTDTRKLIKKIIF